MASGGASAGWCRASGCLDKSFLAAVSSGVSYIPPEDLSVLSFSKEMRKIVVTLNYRLWPLILCVLYAQRCLSKANPLALVVYALAIHVGMPV